MSIRWTILLQLAAMFMQMVVPTVPGFPSAWTPFCHALLGFLQAAQALLAHMYNPDGSQALRLTIKGQSSDEAQA
jgi:hypothetical protein